MVVAAKVKNVHEKRKDIFLKYFTQILLNSISLEINLLHNVLHILQQKFIQIPWFSNHTKYLH